MQIYWPWQIRVVVKRGRKIKEGNFTCVPTYEAHENRRRRRVKITPKEEGRKERRELFSINPWNSFFCLFRGHPVPARRGGEGRTLTNSPFPFFSAIPSWGKTEEVRRERGCKVISHHRSLTTLPPTPLRRGGRGGN